MTRGVVLVVDAHLAGQRHARTRARATDTHAYAAPVREVVRAETNYLHRAIEAFLLSPVMPRCPLHLAKRGEIIKRVEWRRPRSVRTRQTEREGGGEGKGKDGDGTGTTPPGYMYRVHTDSSHAAARN